MSSDRIGQQEAMFINKFADDLDAGIGLSRTKQAGKGSDVRALEEAFSNMYYQWLSGVLINAFKYEGFPDTVNWRYLEYLLRIQSGYAGVGLNSSGEAVVFSQIGAPFINAYGEYASTSGNGTFQKIYHAVTGKDLNQIFTNNPNKGNYAVFVNRYNGLLGQSGMTTDVRDIRFFADELAMYRGLMHYNALFQKVPYIFLGPKDSMDSRNLWTKIMGGETFIPVSEKFDLSQIEKLPIDTPFEDDKYRQAQLNLLQDFLTMKGINNVGMNKRERLTDDEAQANNQLLNHSMQAYLAPRQNAVDLLNKRFGWNVKISVDIDYLSNLHLPNDQKDTDNGVASGEIQQKRPDKYDKGAL